MSLKSTVLALAAAATLATGMTAATTSSAQAGYVVKVKYGHHHGYYGHYYKPRHYYPAYYGCFWKPRQVWTYHGPVWVSKRVCY